MKKYMITRRTGSGGGGGNCIVDQTYNPESENAQSGKAISFALSEKYDKDRRFGLVAIDDVYNHNYEKCATQITLKTSDTATHMMQIYDTLQADKLLNTKADKAEIDTKIGDIETALDNIIDIQSSLLGVTK